MHELHWGIPVIGYLFFAGLGAGAMTVSASIFLRGRAGESGGEHFRLARYGALLAPIPLAFGTALIVLELGSFQAAIANGEYLKMFKFLNLFRTINLSPMSIGTWLLAFGIIVSIAYGYLFWPKDSAPDDDKNKLRKMVAWVAVPLGLGVAVYTGVLLGALPARPFWNTPILAIFFLVSALSTGVAGIILVRLFANHRVEDSGEEAAPRDGVAMARAGYLLAGSDLLLIGAELLLVFLLIMFAHLTIGSPAEAIKVILPGGSLAIAFWIGVVTLGLLVPGFIQLNYVTPTLVRQHAYAVPVPVEFLAAVFVLIGGFLLRYVVVVAGQVTGPIGI